jgi:hypothetical protein
VLISEGVSSARLADWYYHGLFLKDGVLYGLGDNTEGQFGMPYDGEAHYTPVAITSLPVRSFAGGYFSTFIVTDDNKLYGCGSNSEAELGLGYRSTRVESLTLIATNVQDVYPSWGNTTWFTNVGGALYGMGDNFQGLLGEGSYALVPTMLIPSGVAILGGRFAESDEIIMWSAPTEASIRATITGLPDLPSTVFTLTGKMIWEGRWGYSGSVSFSSGGGGGPPLPDRVISVYVHSGETNPETWLISVWDSASDGSHWWGHSCLGFGEAEGSLNPQASYIVTGLTLANIPNGEDPALGDITITTVTN